MHSDYPRGSQSPERRNSNLRYDGSAPDGAPGMPPTSKPDSPSGFRRFSDPVGFFTAVLVCTAVWVVWNESYSVRSMLEGLVLSLIVLVITNRYLLKAPYHTVFRLHPLTVLRYIGVLVVEIYRSGVHAMYVTLSGKIDVGVVELPTAITNPFHGVLVANAITLTPGTVTIHHSDGIFLVVWIECLTNDPDQAAQMIKGRFERVFIALEREST